MAMPRVAISADTWSRWWNRVSQLAGLAIILWEVYRYGEHPSFVALLFASAMMLGSAGVRILVRGAASMAEDAENDDAPH